MQNDNMASLVENIKALEEEMEQELKAKWYKY